MPFPVLSRLVLVIAGLAAALSALATPAYAQWPRDDRFFIFRDPFRPQYRPPPPPSPFSGFPGQSQRPSEGETPAEEAGTVYGSAEAADRFRTTQATQYVVVIGDSLADQLAQGLADAFVSERPEVAIVKKTRGSSGLVRADFYDWPAQLPGLLENEKPSALVAMLGTNDRQVLRDEKGAYEIRSDRWRELYVLRIEALVNELKKKGVPVFIVGLPSMRLPRLSADLQYINEILREQAQRLGVIYVDIWDGFIGDNDEFVMFGPALDGQRRRLRGDDGVHFSRIGARKAAHYVERDLIRLFDLGPRGPLLPQEGPEKDPVPTGRPVAGPVLPLVQPAGPVGGLAGGEQRTAPNTDSIAKRVLMEGLPAEPVAGRADDFRWPRPAPGENPAQKVAAPAAPGTTQTVPGAANEPAQKREAPVPSVITPSASGQRVISVPEQNRSR